MQQVWPDHISRPTSSTPSRIRLAASMRRLYMRLSALALPLSLRPNMLWLRLATSRSTRYWASLSKVCMVAGLLSLLLRLDRLLPPPGPELWSWSPGYDRLALSLDCSQMLAVSLSSVSDMFLSSSSGDELLGVRTPVARGAFLFTRGKLRMVPVDSNDEMEGRCSMVAALLAGLRATGGCCVWRGSSALFRLKLPPMPGLKKALRAVRGLSGPVGMLMVCGGKSGTTSSDPELDRLVRLARPSVAVANDSIVEVEPPLPRLLRRDEEVAAFSPAAASRSSVTGPLVVSTEPSELKLPRLPRPASRCWLIVPRALCRIKCS